MQLSHANQPSVDVSDLLFSTGMSFSSYQHRLISISWNFHIFSAGLNPNHQSNLHSEVHTYIILHPENTCFPTSGDHKSQKSESQDTFPMTNSAQVTRPGSALPWAGTTPDPFLGVLRSPARRWTKELGQVKVTAWRRCFVFHCDLQVEIFTSRKPVRS